MNVGQTPPTWHAVPMIMSSGAVKSIIAPLWVTYVLGKASKWPRCGLTDRPEEDMDGFRNALPYRTGTQERTYTKFKLTAAFLGQAHSWKLGM